MNQLEEVWLPVQGYEGAYEISNLGRVKSLPRPTIINKCTDRSRTLKERILVTPVTTKGFLTVNLSKAGKNRTHNLHLLVARHFLPGVPSKQVRFRDGNKHNCAAHNLYWFRQGHADFYDPLREAL